MAESHSTQERFWSKVRKTDNCWLWAGSLNNDGYGNFHDHGTHSCKAHRFAWRITFGAIPSGMNVCHSCDVRHCVNPAHLFLGTQRDNMRDCRRKGRYSSETGQVGSEHHYSKLTEEKVREIRKLRADGMTLKAIASRYDVNWHTVQNIFNGHTWGHVK